jgi:hypothetical protein
VLEDDAHLQAIHHYGVTFAPSQRFSRERFVFMVVVTDDRPDTDRLNPVQKALGYRGGRIDRLDPRIGDATVCRMTGGCPGHRAGNRHAEKPEKPFGRASLGWH